MNYWIALVVCAWLRRRLPLCLDWDVRAGILAEIQEALLNEMRQAGSTKL